METPVTTNQWNRSKRLCSSAPAQEYAGERKERYRRKRKLTGNIRKYIVARRKGESWSPEQIVGDAKKQRGSRWLNLRIS